VPVDEEKQMSQWKLSIGCAAVALSLAGAACGGDSVTDGREDQVGVNDDTGTQATPGEDPTVGTGGVAGSVTVADLVSAPDKYFGQTVTVVADVDEVFGPNAFALDEDSPIAGGIDNDLLVFSRKAGSLAPIDDQWTNNKVRVTGTVGRMSVVEAERELGWDLDPQLEVELEKRTAVLIAQSVERTEGEDASENDRPATQP
jgi:hypothetical protein